ncbi:MAG: GntR family transcriptional regulator [Syntrophomonadaceae bacterium]|mgnify:CR=1 FL=1|nr:GntR family transcriptional regulator [Syntrophomonadaceae bacterium]
MWLEINPRSCTPIYQQVVDGVKELVARGILVPGERMPTVRELAVELSLNPNTIAKAYQRLEQEGIIETMRSRGTFVAGRTEVLDMEAVREQLAGLVEKVLVEAYHLGLNRKDIKQLFEESLDNWEKRGGK